MKRVWSRVDVEAPLDEVWELLVAIRYWPVWGPSVRAVDLAAERIGPGTKGRVQTAIGVWLPFEITRFEPQSYWDWNVAGVGATGHRVTPLSERRTRVEFSVPWVLAPYRAVLALGLRRLKALAEERTRRSETA